MREYKNVLDLSKSVGLKQYIDGSTVYIFKCLRCPAEISAKLDYLQKHSGLCRICAQRKRPYESLLSTIKNTNGWKKGSDLSYEEFLEFTKIEKCHYCESLIEWQKYRNSREDNKKYFWTERILTLDIPRPI
jgi:hypothetical protein